VLPGSAAFKIKEEIMTGKSSQTVEEDEILEAHCDGMSIRIGRPALQETPEHALENHLIISPGMNASLTLGHRNGGGELQAVRISDRHVALVPAQQAHSTQWSTQSQATAILMRPSFLRDLVRNDGWRNQKMAAQYASIDPFMWHMTRSIEIQMRARRTLEKSFVESIAMVIGQHLLTHYTDTPYQSQLIGGLPAYKVRSATEYVRKHYQRDISFKDIADHLQMSPFHFARMFKHSTGESPHQFIVRCRIDAAKKLLIEGERGIADIAFEVGYKSQSYFTTRFAQFVGATPAAFRTAH
jgi:AraC family transcriptional regulator